MGVNCCSNAKESPDITITKPEKNMTSTSQNPIIKNEKKFQDVITVENKSDNINQKELTQQIEDNNKLILEQKQNNPLSITEKEINPDLNNINNNIMQNKALNIEELSKQQIVNIPKEQTIQNIQIDKNIQNIPKEQKVPNTQNILNQNVYMSQVQNKNLNQNIPNINDIQNNGNNNVNININEIVNNQNNQQINNETDKYIDELLKKSFTSPNVYTNSDINLDVFFNQNDNTKIDDALIDKLFESAGKPLIESPSKTNNILNLQNPVIPYGI